MPLRRHPSQYDQQGAQRFRPRPATRESFGELPLLKRMSPPDLFRLYQCRLRRRRFFGVCRRRCRSASTGFQRRTRSTWRPATRRASAPSLPVRGSAFERVQRAHPQQRPAGSILATKTSRVPSGEMLPLVAPLRSKQSDRSGAKHGILWRIHLKSRDFRAWGGLQRDIRRETDSGATSDRAASAQAARSRAGAARATDGRAAGASAERGSSRSSRHVRDVVKPPPRILLEASSKHPPDRGRRFRR